MALLTFIMLLLINFYNPKTTTYLIASKMSTASPSHTAGDSRHLIREGNSIGKGRGHFAAAIPQGTRILAEEGLFKTKNNKTSDLDIAERFLALSHPQNIHYLKLKSFSRGRDYHEVFIDQEMFDLR